MYYLSVTRVADDSLAWKPGDDADTGNLAPRVGLAKWLIPVAGYDTNGDAVIDDNDRRAYMQAFDADVRLAHRPG